MEENLYKLSTVSLDTDTKRTSYLEWDEYFMALAILSAKRSKDPCTQVGACIIDQEHKIIGIGYNGMPRGCDDDDFPWCKGSEELLNNKKLYVCHAEINAILNSNFANVKNCTMYVTLFPCNECAKLMIQSGIREFIYISDKHDYKAKTRAAKKMFDYVGIKYRKYTPKIKQIVVDFSEI
ncbi:deoxycytidylate deaminase [Prorops nasuta]|uniref:deoxycytidylate deaminase n=1 Tax=Prorops nasuta TaxID=863751 RepID=UPI0034CE19A1